MSSVFNSVLHNNTKYIPGTTNSATVASLLLLAVRMIIFFARRRWCFIMLLLASQDRALSAFSIFAPVCRSMLPPAVFARLCRRAPPRFYCPSACSESTICMPSTLMPVIIPTVLYPIPPSAPPDNFVSVCAIPRCFLLSLLARIHVVTLSAHRQRAPPYRGQPLIDMSGNQLGCCLP